MIKRFYFIPFLFLIAACCGTQGPRMKAGFVPKINLVEIVFKSLDDKLLFAGPVKFRQENGKDVIALDITSEFVNKVSDSATFRFTVITKIRDLSFPAISMVGGDTLFSSNNFDLMFKEAHNKYFHYRYAFTTSYSVFQKVLEAESPKLILGSNYVFNAGRRWPKDAKVISGKIALITSGYL